MPSIFSKNAIISGDVDYYCLVCEDKLKLEENVNTHIQKAIHKKNLDQRSSYVKIYENEKIRKVNKGYYCEYCNILLRSYLKISFHVNHKNHEYNKSDDIDVTTVNKHAKRYENCIILFDYLLIAEKAWNGLIGNNCVYCNNEFDNEELHKMESNHILNIIQAQLLIGEKRSVYRKIDNHTFHCITCNELLPLPIESHFEQDTHDERYIQCRKDKKALHDKMQKNTPMIETPKKQILKENLLQKTVTESLTKPQVDANEFANANQKIERKETDATKVTGEKIKTDNQSILELDPLEALVKKLDLKDYIYFNEKGEILCVLCEWNLSSSDEPVKPHIQGRHHQEILKLHKQRIEKENRKKKIGGCQKETTQSKNNATETSLKENNSKCENVLKENECTATSTEDDNKSASVVVQSTSKSDILNNIADLQKHAISINFIHDKAVCTKCNISLPFEIETIRNHIKEHSNTKSKDYPSLGRSDENATDGTKLFTRPVFVSKSENKPETPDKATISTINETKNPEKAEGDNVLKFASENYINYNFSPNQAYCRICRTQIPNSLTSMKEHVRGARHSRNTPEEYINMITPVVSQKPYRTKTLKEFMRSLCEMRILFQQDWVILNKKFCLSPISFHIITKIGERLRCHICEINFNILDVNNHLRFDSHASRLMDTPVLISEETEFIRIIRDEVFHCGFCNLILAGWSEVQNHIKSLTHVDYKLKSAWALDEALPEVEAHEIRQASLNMFRTFFGGY